jgi:hypothetical protein
MLDLRIDGDAISARVDDAMRRAEAALDRRGAALRVAGRRGVYRM